MKFPPTATSRVPSAEVATAVQAFVGALVRVQLCADAKSNLAEQKRIAAQSINFFMVILAFKLFSTIRREFIHQPGHVKRVVSTRGISMRFSRSPVARPGGL